MHWVDMPPIWLIGAVAVVWVLDGATGGGFGALWRLGPVLVVAGAVLLGAGVAQMLARRTTVVPREVPAVLVTDGLFRYSRNPIYLGDAMILAGVILWRDVPLALPVLAGFVWVIQTRFILGEEAGLRRAFGPAYAIWSQKTGRWLGWQR